MGRLVVIKKTNEDSDIAYYRYGPSDVALMATAAISKTTGEILLLGVDEDGALRSLNWDGRHLLRVALRRVKQGDSYPQSFTFRPNIGGLATVKVINQSETKLEILVDYDVGKCATAIVDLNTGEPTFTSLEPGKELSIRQANSQFTCVVSKLREHFAKGEFPAETAFIS